VTADMTRRAILTLITPPSDELTDNELLTSFIEQLDMGAFETIVRRHGAMVFGVCQRVLRHRQDAEDAFQATFLVLARKASSVVPREALANWLYGVARKASLKAREMNARRRKREARSSGTSEPVSSAAIGLSQELRDLLDSELARLPDHYRSVIVLCDLEGRTRKEAARHLKCPVGSVSSRLSRARDMLARRLTRRGVVLAGSFLCGVLTTESTFGMHSKLMVLTIKATIQLLTRCSGMDGAIPERVRSLTEGVLQMMTMSHRKALATVFFALAIVGVSAYGFVAGTEPPPPPKQPNQPSGAAPTAPKANTDLQGIWILQTAEHFREDGGSAWMKFMDDHYQFVVTNEFLIWKRGSTDRELTYKTEPEKVPGYIDMKVLAEGPDKGKLIRGIYAIAGDELKLCEAAVGEERPTQFSITGQGRGRTLYTLSRQHPKGINYSQKELQGRWTLVSCRENRAGVGIATEGGKTGNTLIWNRDSADRVGQMSLVIEGNTVTMIQKEKRIENRSEGKITFYANDPQSIDFPIDGNTCKGIYSVQGDTLVLAYGDAGGWYKLTDTSFVALLKTEMPETVRLKLIPLKDKVLSQEELRREISKLLDKDETKQFQNLIVDNANERPTSFSTRSKSSTRVLVFVRENDEDKR